MEDSAGMAQNAPVRLNGILGGPHRNDQLSGSHDPKRTVEIDMEIPEKYLRSDSGRFQGRHQRGQSAGRKYINITKGTHRNMWRRAAKSQSLQTQDIPEILAQSVQPAGAVPDHSRTGSTACSRSWRTARAIIGKLIKDDTLYDRLNATAGEVEQLVKDVKNSNGTISHLLYDDALYNDIRKPIQRLDDMLAQVQQGRARAGKLLYDPQLYDEARRDASAEAKKMLDNLNAGKGRRASC